MEELILHYVDIDTRRALGLPVRKLPPSDLALQLPTYVNTEYGSHAYAYVIFIPLELWIEVTQRGHVMWSFKGTRYHHSRP
jgi:hypothetical protein